MAIATKNPSSLKIKFYLGLDSDSKEIYKTKTFSGLKPDAVDDDVYAVAEAMASLQEYDLNDVIKVDNTALSL